MTWTARWVVSSAPTTSPTPPKAWSPNSSAALLIWEDTWAVPLVEAMRGSGGVLLEGGRIPHDLAEEAFAGLASAGA